MKYNNPILDKIYQDETKLISDRLEKQQAYILPIFQEFIKKQKKLGNINEFIGIELYAYFNTVNALLSYDDEYDRLPENIKANFLKNQNESENKLLMLDADFIVPVINKEAMEHKYRTKITPTIYETFEIDLRNYVCQEVHIWIASIWQKAELDAVVPIAFMLDYHDGNIFDLKQMKFVLNRGPLLKENLNLPNYTEEELRFRIAHRTSDRQVLQKGNIYKEIGYALERSNDVSYLLINRTYENKKVIDEKITVFSLNENSNNNTIFRWEAADLLRDVILDVPVF